jgi:hypothetical protein
MMKPLRLTTVIEREKQQVGNYNALARRINELNAEKKIDASISRKTLEKIVEKPAKVNLTWRNLVALDTYLSPMGEGLDDQPVLEKLGILHCVANPKNKVSFLVGAKPRPRARRCDLSPWDMRSTAIIVQGFSVFNPHVQHEIVDVLLGTHRDESRLINQPWFPLLDDANHTLISIGSPLACLSSEVMLARMFCVKPFEPPASLEDKAPFCFIWPPKRCRNLRSRFALPGKAIPPNRPALRKAVLKNRAAAFHCQGQLFKVPVEGTRWEMYAIIAAQRRRLGQVWVVISGQSGPATYAAATKLKEITNSLPWTAGEDGPVLWAVVEASIRAIRQGYPRGDDRDVLDARLLGKAQVWEPR